MMKDRNIRLVLIDDVREYFEDLYIVEVKEQATIYIYSLYLK